MSEAVAGGAPPSRAQAWWLAARPRTLAAGLAPVALGTALAHATGGVRPSAAFAALLAAIGVQIGSNLANDYYDFVKGADTAARVGPARATQQGWLKPNEVWWGMVIVLGLSLAASAWLVALGGWPVVAIALASVTAAVAYTGGPYPLAYLGLGDVFVWIFFGPVGVMGTTYVQTGAWRWEAFVAGSAIGLGAASILVVNNLRDRHTDAQVGKRTLAVRLGSTGTRVQYGALWLLAYAHLFAMVATGGSRGWLLPLAALPMAVWRTAQVARLDGPALNAELGASAKLTLLFSLLLALGLLGGV
jgi:1,4-dihydroxy-2-naphthoate octaprenyltransferase